MTTLKRCCLLVGACCSFSLVAVAAEPNLKVAAFKFDALPSLMVPPAKEIAAELTAQNWCTAEPSENSTDWNQLPIADASRRTVSFVTTGFNEQADAFAFVFDGTDRTISRVVHMPFRRVWMPNNTLAWVWPKDDMLGGLKVAIESGVDTDKRPPLTLKIVPWQDDTTDPALKTNLDEARALDPAVVLRSLKVMASAAAFQTGWAPSTAKSKHFATCAVRVENQTCSFQLTMRGPGGERTSIKEGVSWESYYPHLLRLFRSVDPTSGIGDFAQLGEHPLDLLSIDDGKLACTLNHELAVFDLTTGKTLWTTEPVNKPTGYNPRPTYASIAEDRPRLVRFAGQLAEMDWNTGATKPLAPAGVDASYRFDLSATGDVASISADTLTLYRGQDQLWQKTQFTPITAGPMLLEEDVVIGDSSGELVCFALKDGSARWRKNLRGRIYGRIVPEQNLLLACCDETESLIAVDRGTGDELWRLPLGDVLLKPPAVIGKELFVVTKSNRLLLIDLSKGTPHLDIQWPTWIIGATVVPTRPQPTIACADLDGTVSLLSTEDFKVIKRFSLATELVENMLYVERIAPRWPVVRAKPQAENLAEEIVERPPPVGPSLLASDKHGFLYILPLTSAK